MRAYVRALRPRQWVKNLLVFAAPLAAGDFLDPKVLLLTLGAFVAFTLASAGTYLVNDCVDVESDRRHETKRFRPIAAGDISVRVAVAGSVLLFTGSLVVAALINIGLMATVGTYIGLSVFYSLRLKHEPVLELAILASGFLLRAIAGGVAAEIPLSPWFLLVAGFGALSVAAGKRLSEMQSNPEDAPHRRKSLEGYTQGYLRFVWISSTAVLITTYCLWVIDVPQPPSPVPWALLSIVPFLLVVLRFGIDVDRGKAQEPELALFKDPALLTLGLLWVVLLGFATVGLG